MSTSSIDDDAVTDIITGRVQNGIEKVMNSEHEKPSGGNKKKWENETKKTCKHNEEPLGICKTDDDSSASGSTSVETGLPIGSVLALPTSLHRNEERLTTRPGVIAVPGVLSSSADIENRIESRIIRGDIENNQNIAPDSSNESPSILVSAQLVQETQDENDIENGEIAVSTLVQAEPIKENIEEGSGLAGLGEILKSRTVQLVLFVLCLIITGLVIGVVVGFGSGGQSSPTTSNNNGVTSSTVPNIFTPTLSPSLSPSTATFTPSSSLTAKQEQDDKLNEDLAEDDASEDDNGH